MPKLVYKAKGNKFLGPFEPNLWDLDCAEDEGDSMLQEAEEQLFQPDLM